jgi:hypothetical protein
MNQEKTEVTDTQVTSALKMTMAMAEAIQGLGQVPSGTLYAHVMGRMNLETYERIIAVLIKGGLIRKQGHLLTWVK